jgi:hypothetical protein
MCPANEISYRSYIIEARKGQGAKTENRSIAPTTPPSMAPAVSKALRASPWRKNGPAAVFGT